MKNEANCFSRCFTKKDEVEATQETSFGWIDCLVFHVPALRSGASACPAVPVAGARQRAGAHLEQALPSHSPSLSIPCLRGWFFENCGHTNNGFALIACEGSLALALALALTLRPVHTHAPTHNFYIHSNSQKCMESSMTKNHR